jgi:hypothetical protein
MATAHPLTPATSFFLGRNRRGNIYHAYEAENTDIVGNYPDIGSSFFTMMCGRQGGLAYQISATPADVTCKRCIKALEALAQPPKAPTTPKNTNPTEKGGEMISAVGDYLNAYYRTAEPDFSDYTLVDASEELGVSVPSAKGVLGDLVKKGLAWTHNDGDVALIGLYDAGWAWYDAQEPTEDEKAQARGMIFDF